MNADDYAEAALSTWTTEWSVPEQVAHAAMTIVDEWWEVEDVLDQPVPNIDELEDELGDVLYGTVIMQTLFSRPSFSLERSSSRAAVDYCTRQVHDLATKYFRSSATDYYDADDIAKLLLHGVDDLSRSLCGFIRKHGLFPREVAAENAAKLAARHNTET